MAQVSLQSLTKKFDEVVAVDNVNLEISDKEFVVLVGPSGCGKTTTLRMVAGLEEIYTRKSLDDALSLSATTLESGVLINDGSAHFEFKPLPRLAQISPSSGAVLTARFMNFRSLRNEATSVVCSSLKRT